jgi:hypothetical protein
MDVEIRGLAMVARIFVENWNWLGDSLLESATSEVGGGSI